MIAMDLLSSVHSVEDLKSLRPSELEKLCGEIRSFLIDSLSKTGGHLASNLGVVELTVAIHAVFNSPQDKIIWDVGHQSYVHKILTGRRDQFSTLRRKDGLSGFPKDKESPYDAFNTGHASTSISAAYGYCKARDILDQDYSVVAIIGDGSMTGGLAYEAINNAGRTKTDMVVILNDNQMSISENVGALSRYLNEIRTAPAYIGAKADVNNFLNKIPILGQRLQHFIERTKGGIKYLLVPGSMFEELGFNYIGPIDGHNIKQMLGVLRKVKQMSGPVLLHVYTQKGRGYCQAEEAPSAYHGVDSFHIDTGAPVVTKLWDTYSDVFGKTMVKLAAATPNLVAVSAAMTSGVGLADFAKKYPERMFDVGIAEGHAVTFAAGLAKGGVIPVVAIYSSFMQRAYDQILHDVCLQDLHVIFAVDRAGVVGADGETHQGLYDAAFMSHIPNITIMAPINKRELTMMLEFAVKGSGPIAIRYPKGSASLTLRTFDKPIVLGQSELISQGRDFAIIAVGAMMDIAFEASAALRKAGLHPTLINPRFIKPIDLDMVKSIRNCKAVYVLEDHAASGGFGDMFMRAMSQEQIQVPFFRNFALPDKFIEHGSRDEILKVYGLDVDSIVNEIRSRFK
jgi:1-deoxy-D-xylulose-5-phosphate synthase